MADTIGVPNSPEAATSADLMAALEKQASRAVQQRKHGWQLYSSMPV